MTAQHIYVFMLLIATLLGIAYCLKKGKKDNKAWIWHRTAKKPNKNEVAITTLKQKLAKLQANKTSRIDFKRYYRELDYDKARRYYTDSRIEEFGVKPKYQGSEYEYEHAHRGHSKFHKDHVHNLDSYTSYQRGLSERHRNTRDEYTRNHHYSSDYRSERKDYRHSMIAKYGRMSGREHHDRIEKMLNLGKMKEEKPEAPEGCKSIW